MAIVDIRPRIAEAPRLRRGMLLAWTAFWLLMLSIGIQDHLRSGGHDLARPIVDYLTAAIASTALAAWLLRRSADLDTMLDRPLRWFLRLTAWLPPVALAYVALLYGLRHGLYALAGQPYRHEPWGEVLLYETSKLAIFYALFSGVLFGLRSYLAWNAARLQAAQQESLGREAQLAQLTQQLQPHFLFNALNTVSSLIHSDPDRADALLTGFASLLRAATDAGRRPTHSLAEELQLLEAYAAIMVERFGDRVALRWEIDPAARACEVPTLGLQPLLENCFRHAVERRRATTRIVVRARREGDRLCLEVENDGDPVAEPLRRGVGLGNLAERLAVLHGERGRLLLQPRDGGGLTVRLEWPCGC